MTSERDLRDAGARVEGLLAELESMPAVASRARELVSLLVELYGAGLDRIASVLAARPDGAELMRTLAGDPLVASLLVVHDLHPVPVTQRIQAALDEVRPYLGSHAGGVDFLGVDDEGVARLRLAGSCHGCPSSTMTVATAIERAIFDAAPEVVRVDVQGVTEPRLLQIRSSRPAGSNGGWRHLDGIGPLLPGSLVAMSVDGVALVLCSAGGSLYAYRSACGTCGASLDHAVLNDRTLTCPACGGLFDVRLAGRAIDGDDSLEPIPLLPEDGGWKVAIPQAAGT